jgi:hypothetical protein
MPNNIIVAITMMVGIEMVGILCIIGIIMFYANYRNCNDGDGGMQLVLMIFYKED